MSDDFICWKCGQALTGVIMPMSRREECGQCGADQHVCKMCCYFDERGRGDCTEERAEEITDRERANFCDYFKPVVRAASGAGNQQAEDARAQLAALFGDDVEAAPDSSDSKAEEGLTPAEIAEKKFRDLLGG